MLGAQTQELLSGYTIIIGIVGLFLQQETTVDFFKKQLFLRGSGLLQSLGHYRGTTFSSSHWKTYHICSRLWLSMSYLNPNLSIATEMCRGCEKHL